MARIPLVDLGGGDGGEASGGDELRSLPQLPNILRAIANNPKATEAFGAFGGWVYGGTSLTPAQRELAYLTATAVNNCHY
jgi:alkylhydroperoxidase family enzyme